MTRRSLFQVAGLIAAVTILSKIAGFIRDVVIAQAFGASLVSDAYFYAYQIPSLALILLGGLGGPFHTATIAVFSKIIPDISKKPEPDVQRLLNSFLTITGIGFLVLTFLSFFFSDIIIKIIAAGAQPELQQLAGVQLKIMSPIMLIGGLIGIFYGISNVYNKFLFTAISPVIASIAVILAILLCGGKYGAIVLAWGTLIGAVGELLIQLPAFFKAGFKFRPVLDFSNEKLITIKEILLPAMIGTTIGQINIYVDMFFASQLQPGAWSAIGYANRIFQFPVGIIITAMLVPLFPMFSSFVGKKEWDNLRHYFNKGLLSLWFMAFPILAFIIVFALDTIKLLLQRGEFDATDTLMVTEALVFLSISIIPYVARDTLTRIFYAFDDSKTPFYIAMFSIIAKVVMNFLFVARFGIGGITLSTTGVTLINCLLLAFFIREKISLGYKELINPTIKIFVATVLATGLAYLAKLYLDHVLPDTTVILALKLSIYGVIGLVSYSCLAIIFKISAAESVYERIKARIFKNSEASALEN